MHSHQENNSVIMVGGDKYTSQVVSTIVSEGDPTVILYLQTQRYLWERQRKN